MTSNPESGATRPVTLSEAVRKIQEAKSEHREILERVARDAGMEPDTRWSLISHLYDEEDEQVEHIAQLMAAPPPAGAVKPSRPTASQLTVGSLRPPAQFAQNGGNSVGSLRRKPEVFKGGPGSVGSLRRL